MFYYTGRFSKDKVGNVIKTLVNFHLQKFITHGSYVGFLSQAHSTSLLV